MKVGRREGPVRVGCCTGRETAPKPSLDTMEDLGEDPGIALAEVEAGQNLSGIARNASGSGPADTIIHQNPDPT
jgi:hypothetical protein